MILYGIKDMINLVPLKKERYNSTIQIYIIWIFSFVKISAVVLIIIFHKFVYGEIR